MALDTDHFEAIADLIGSVNRPGRRRERRDLAERVWNEAFTNPSNEIPCEPIGEPTRSRASMDSLALIDRPFEQVAAVDAGSLNPTVFQNGLVVDLAHAALAASPSDIERHRERTIVAVIHGPPAEIRSSEEWTTFDSGYGRIRLLAAPSLEYEENTAVHTLALESAEVEHARHAIDANDDLLALDGAVYPASLLHWESREGTLRGRLYEDVEPKRAIIRAIELVERCLLEGRPIIGVVKNWSARGLVRSIDGEGVLDDAYIPWPTDASLFQQLLANDGNDPNSLYWTGWFTMGFGVGPAISKAIDRLGLEPALDVENLRLVFMVVYYPRDNVVFRIEAPLGAVRDRSERETLTEYVLAEIAAEGGPPSTIRKADALASIGRRERRALRNVLAEVLDTTPVRGYDTVRWDELEPETTY